MIAKIKILTHESILDPQGLAVKGTLRSMGFNIVEKVKIGKFIVLELNCEDYDVAKKQLTSMCEKLLTNPVMESYDISIE